MKKNGKELINVPQKDLNIKPLTKKEIREACIDGNTPRGLRINKEIIDGLNFIRKHPRSVTFFGSSKLKEDNPYYQKAKNLAQKIVKETGYTIVTGGGPGIMEGANKGAREAGGNSLGLGIDLPNQKRLNSHVTDSVEFHYFFTRKVSLAFSAETYLFFPGGYGTLDEFFEILTLVQTKKIEKVPIILVGSEFWNMVDQLLKEHLYEKFKTIDKTDLDLYTITDDEEEIVKIIKNAPLRKED